MIPNITYFHWKIRVTFKEESTDEMKKGLLHCILGPISQAIRIFYILKEICKSTSFYQNISGRRRNVELMYLLKS